MMMDMNDPNMMAAAMANNAGMMNYQIQS